VPRWLALLSCALGAAVILLGLRQAARGRETRGWSHAAGRVLSSRVEEEHGGAEEQGYPRWRFDVRYAYEVRGRTYESGQVWYGSSSAPASQDRAWHQQWADRFPAGGEVDVWYDPADPGRAVLVRGPPRGELAAYLAVGIALVAAGLFVLARMPPR
jgi:hypothetical protein